ncbi:MAG TPA: penicillin acylase family protein [Bacteroidales bacterium]|nr:penicillin acylase family protein [Bacteroidales bacterium]HRT90108.1 penicillin acylase family protein [Bacteroidales bacterium]
MKAIKIALLSLLVLAVIVLIAGLILISSVSRGAIPKYNGELKISGLKTEVTVYRDERGMPHIYAGDEYDLYFATGYVMAQERLWQMDLIRRATTGRLSEIFGKDYVKTDLFLRSLCMTDKSERVIASTEPEILDCLRAFTDGVNRYIEDAGRKLPPEFRILSYRPDPWTLTDLANIIGYMGWDLASDNLYSELFNYRLVEKAGPEKAVSLIPDWKAECTTVFPSFRLEEIVIKKALDLITSMQKLSDIGVASFSGSNNWAVAGSRTETGKPFLCNDMHLSLGSPGIWIQMHQVIPGKLNVTGVVVPGEPFVVGGHNEKIAWGMTNLMVDDIDLFAEKIHPDDSSKYFFNGNWVDMKIKEEKIRIKGGKDTTLVLRFTHRGPVISGLEDTGGSVISMHWSGYDESNEIRTVYLLNRAGNFEEFRKAISHFRSISQNFVYADVDGNIGLNTGGGIPVRKGPGTLVRNGETDEWDWRGYVPFDQLPWSFNPPEGHVSSANNKTVSDDYPYFISSEFALPYRIDRIRKMLGEKQMYTTDDFKRMITDQTSEYAALLTPFIIKAAGNAGDLSETEKAAYDALSRWNYEMNKDLAAPTVFEYCRHILPRKLLGDELGELYNSIGGTPKDYYVYRILKEGPDEWVDDVTTEKKETLDDIILKSFKESVAQITGRCGPDTARWKWGDIHTMQLMHPMGSVKILDRIFGLNSDTYRTGGSNHTVSPYSYNNEFRVNHGASERHIFNTADWDASLTIIPTGISGVPASRFYLSQTKRYVEGGFYNDFFSEKAVKENAKYKLILKPEQGM